MIWNIPVRATTDAFAQQVELDGVIFDLAFRWNPRDAHWALDVGRGGTVLLAGVKLVNTSDILSEYRRVAGLPAGRLFVTDLDGRFRAPDATLFGTRVVLQYQDLNV